ncbi:MAG: Gfo/Idh/MocA family oxidoreductase [Akkermansiaceae bacterium]|jgi:predicted dehydrogenase|nr:Gfo/Idh/MocA family oxidoreductase [Akkermansiaceae bacterium]
MTFPQSRRNFIRLTASAIAGPTVLPSGLRGQGAKAGPNSRVQMAAVGFGPRGRLVLNSFLKQADARFVAVCDVQPANLKTGKMMVDRAHGTSDCAATADLREILAREDVDAVLIATGDRWHAVASMMAVKAGKDVYSEKPCAITMAECRELDETVRLYQRVFQAGTQRRNVANFRHAVSLAQTGKLGRIHTVHASIYKLRELFDWLPAEPEPPDIDWDRWLGPAPWRPFNMAYLRGRWRIHHDFDSGRTLLDWGAHTVDLCQWALGMDGTTPVEFDPDGNTIRARYANGAQLVLREGGFMNEGQWLGLGSCPVRFEGDAGWVEAGDAGKIIAHPASLLEGVAIPERAGTDPDEHVREFLDCVKSRASTASNSANTRSSHVACHAAAIASRLGRKLTFDPATESFVNDDEANRLRSRARRSPWHA